MKSMKYLLTGALILTQLASMNGLVAYAADEEEAVEPASKGTSVANFELQAGDENTIPELIDPEVQPPTGNKGPLSLDAVSSFNFPTKKLGTESKLPLEASPVEGTKLGVQVTDERGADLGWNLKVSATPFQTSDKTLELKGAVMTIPEGKLTTKQGVDPLLTPSAFKVDLSPDPTSIMSASTTQGRSTWLNTFEEKGEKVTLAVPSGNKVASYSSTITWTLEDAP